MKQSFFKPVFLILALSMVSAMVGAGTNACDKTLVTKDCFRQQAAKQKKAPVKETAVYTDFILTNSILRF